jgi:hypothetical protein
MFVETPRRKKELKFFILIFLGSSVLTVALFSAYYDYSREGLTHVKSEVFGNEWSDGSLAPFFCLVKDLRRSL